MSEPGEAQHSENDESTGGESEIKSVLSATNEKGILIKNENRCQTTDIKECENHFLFLY